MNSLAPELIDHIIGHVDRKDRISRSHLQACSLVCRFWLPSSQCRLFYHIDLSTWWTSDLRALHFQRLDDVLFNSPHLASYIRVLELPDLSLAVRRCRYWKDAGGIALDKRLSSLLRKFTQVQKLRFWGLAWNLLPEYVRQSLCRILELPSMAVVCIHEAQFINMDDFTNFLNHARGPIHLSLNPINTSWVPPYSIEVETKHTEDNKEKFEGYISQLSQLDLI